MVYICVGDALSHQKFNFFCFAHTSHHKGSKREKKIRVVQSDFTGKIFLILLWRQQTSFCDSALGIPLYLATTCNPPTHTT